MFVISKQTVLLITICVAMLFCSVVESQSTGSVYDPSHLGSFNRDGYPTITIVGGTFLILLVFIMSGSIYGMGGFVNDILWFIIELFIYFAAVNLACGPDLAIGYDYSNSDGYFSSTNSARAAVIGLQLMLQVAIGTFTIYSHSHYGALLYVIVAVFNTLCLMGVNLLFNHTVPIWLLNQPQCNTYFNTVDLTRCRDNGFIEWLRVLGNLLILVEFLAIVMAVRAYVLTLVGVPVPAGGAYAPAGTGAAVGGPVGVAAPGATTVVQPTATGAGYATTTVPTGPAYTQTAQY